MSTDPRDIVRRNNRRFSEGIRNRDLETIEGLYAEDAVLMPPNNEMITGKKGSRDFWSAAIKMGLREATLKTAEARLCGNEIHEVGSYKLKVEPEKQAAYEDIGKYMIIWRAEPDGTWKLGRDIWNSDLPRKNRR